MSGTQISTGTVTKEQSSELIRAKLVSGTVVIEKYKLKKEF